MDAFISQYTEFPLESRSVSPPLSAEGQWMESTFTPGSFSASLGDTIIKLGQKWNCCVSSVFLALDLAHRLPPMSSTSSKYAIPACLLVLSMAFFNEDMHDFHEIGKSIALIPSELSKLTMKIIISLQGDIYHRTYWDYASSQSQLGNLLYWMVHLPTYDPSRFPVFPTSPSTLTKDIRMSQLVIPVVVADPTEWTPVDHLMGICYSMSPHDASNEVVRLIEIINKLPDSDRHRFDYYNRLLSFHSQWSSFSSQVNKMIKACFANSTMPVIAHLWSTVSSFSQEKSTP
jgi:hypothetical protein